MLIRLFQTKKIKKDKNKFKKKKQHLKEEKKKEK